MKHFLAILAIVALPAFAGHLDGVRGRNHYEIINQASDLVPWCRAEAESRYIARNITPYQWTASYHDSSNVLYVDGKLRVHDDDVTVRCRIARGARASYATIEIDDPSLH